MGDLKHVMEDHYLKYASYVILDRAIPNIVDGLKPVQRRILYTLFQMENAKLHKVANVVGQTMALHPHGDAPIYEALVNLANKNYLLDKQGNFGNLYTGDPSAAARYIETRLSELSKETMFNPDLTETALSYDSRHKEPLVLPAKIPLLLMQGADGIAVGMSTHILPHNFVELLEAEIAILEGRDFTLVPDFPTAGIMDASEYDHGRGKVKLRAKIEVRDPKTLVITEICYGTTTESLIRSIDEAAKKGKIRIESINDYTSDKVEVEIKLPRGQYAEELIDALYVFTECQVSLTSQLIVIKDNYPWEADVKEMLKFHAEKLQGYLQRELEIELGRLHEKVFNKTLEQIFIENRIYKDIETKRSYEAVHQAIMDGLIPYHNKLNRVPTEDDRERLLSIPIRRISRFDIEKNEKEISELLEEIARIEKDLKNMKKFTINFIKGLLKQYGKLFARKTKIEEIRQLDLRAIQTKSMKVGFDPETGFVGTKIAGPHLLECTNFDKILILFEDGTYSVMNIPEKQYIAKQKVLFVGVADKKTVFNVIYKDPKTLMAYAKRFIVEKFILDKSYRFLEENMHLEHLTTNSDAKMHIVFVPKVKQKISAMDFVFNTFLVKGVSAKGIKIASRAVKKVSTT
ncbi:MAG: DNA topoisomerase IV subunit A [Bacteriovorax sp.]|jgi:topoisomerase-4 subunit A